MKVGFLLLKLDSHEIAVSNNPVAMTAKEFDVLRFIMMRKGEVLIQLALLSHLYQDTDQPDAKIIDVFICKVRKKLAHADTDNLIGTVWGEGYILEDSSGSGLHQAPSACHGTPHTYGAAA